MTAARGRVGWRGTPDPMRLVALSAAGGIPVASAWFTTLSDPRGSADVKCAERYASARTEEDSARVNAEMLDSTGPGITSCGALRQAGRVR